MYIYVIYILCVSIYEVSVLKMQDSAQDGEPAAGRGGSEAGVRLASGSVRRSEGVECLTVSDSH